jgi:protein phosphatase
MSTDRPLTVVEVAGASDPGRVRTHNEDRSLAEPPLMVVADGMGGAQAGEVAAGMAVDRLRELGTPAERAALQGAIEEANREIHAAAEADPEKAGMGTTVTAALLNGNTIELAHVGDSRAYLWREGDLSQLTDDHSVVAELVRLGKLSPEEAGRHPHRNVITRALGAEATVAVDVSQKEARAGDVVLLCSDGLTTHLDDEQIAREMRAGGTLKATADRLVRRANQAGGTDNVTVVLARIGRADRPRRRTTEASAETRPIEAPTESKGETTAEMPAMRSLRGQVPPPGETDDPKARRPRVLQPVSGRRRSRLRPAAVAIVVVLLLGAGAVWWVASRSYAVSEGDDGEALVVHGLPFEVLGVSLSVPWQELDVSADAVRASDEGALADRARGQGEAVEIAARVVWAAGLPDAPPIVASAEPAAPATGGADAAPDATEPSTVTAP